MQVIVIGLPFFATKVADLMKSYYPADQYRVLSLGRRTDRIRFGGALLRADAVYLIGGTLPAGRAVRLAKRLGRRVVMHWVGSDVTTAAGLAKSGANLAPEGIRHLCEVEWIQQELAAIGVIATIRALAAVPVPDGPSPPLPVRFTVGAYVGKGREAFYGMDTIVALAKSFPDVEFLVAGTEHRPADGPPNLEILGWVQDISAFWDRCTLTLRLTEHDGLAFSVLEALARGRYVGYRQPYPEAIHLPTVEAAREVVARFRDEVRAGRLDHNVAGREFVRRAFDPRAVATALHQELGGGP